MVLLVVLIFPVISMTDDLLAMSAPSEFEHVLRRYEAPLDHLASPGVISTLALVFVPSLSFALKPEPVDPAPVMAELGTVCVRVTGVRPPPDRALLAPGLETSGTAVSPAPPKPIPRSSS